MTKRRKQKQHARPHRPSQSPNLESTRELAVAQDQSFQKGIEAHAKGDLAVAENWYLQALAENPDHAHALNNYAVLLKTAGRVDEAIAFYRKAIDRAEDPIGVMNNLAIALLVQRRFSEVLELLGRAIVLSPGSVESLFHFASALREVTNFDLSRKMLEYAVRISPGHGAAQCNLGSLLRLLGSFRPALNHLEAAARLTPTLLEVHVNLADTYKDHGLIKEAVPHYARAFALNPQHAESHSNLLLALNYTSGRSGLESLKAHKFWAQQHADKLLPADSAYRNSPDPDRKLRLGLVSSDMRRHSVGYFLEPLFEHLDRDSVEIFAYTNSSIEDEFTARFKALSVSWRSVVGVSNEAAAQVIRNDGVDILMDATGHTGGNRLLVFAHKPAPVQFTWLGYPNTTGMAAMDFRVTDAITDPIGSSDPWYTERIIRLGRPFLCYRPPPEANLPVAPAPATASGIVKFGSFNNIAKLTPQVVNIWGRLLATVQNGRLILKSRCFQDEETKSRFTNLLLEGGARYDQIALFPHDESSTDHFSAYNRIDIGLDPFPYNGTTTTFEALWMGVPVVTLQGEQHAGRVGTSILVHAGLGDLVAVDEASYIAIAAGLASNPRRIADLRAGMRERLRRSSLLDEKGFSVAFGDALRGMWKSWCFGRADGPAR
ncbi:MAG: tetratricopeptide repeat protein [Alphaproteobacteria bacterium]|nr:tetratricopeptide repeat protein [Alphaproteobacteria bacterium]